MYHFDQLHCVRGRVQTEPNRLESYLPLGLTNEHWTRTNLKSTLD